MLPGAECWPHVALQEGPGEAAVQALGEAVETPERLWTPAMKTTTAEEVAHLANQAHAAQVYTSTQTDVSVCLAK